MIHGREEIVGDSQANSDISEDLSNKTELMSLVEGLGPTSYFDSIIGHIEDIVVDLDFQQLQNNFLEKYFTEFDDGEENKLSYTRIFEEYIELLENYIESKLKSSLPNFSMEEFYVELKKRQRELDGEVFEMLFTLSDFLAFKELLLDYKAEKEGRVPLLHQDLTVTAYKCS